MTTETSPSIALEMLTTIARHGSARAATALGAFSGDVLTTGVAAARVLALPDIPMLGGDPEATVVGIHIGMDGDLAGSVLATFTMADARMLLAALMLEPDGDAFDELALSALSEAGNIIVSAFLAALEPLCGLVVVPTPPMVVVEMRGAILVSAVLPVVDAGGEVLLIDAEIVPAGDAATMAACEIVFLPTPDAWNALSRALTMVPAEEAAR
jgi:chemotaxis protein CheC